MKSSKCGLAFRREEMSASDVARYAAKVEKRRGCWKWTGGCRNPYGAFWINGRNVAAHKVAFALANASVPAGAHVCHRCDNPTCVNPGHLFIGTAFDNNHDMRMKGREARLKGERRGHAKLRDRDIPVIRSKYATGRYSYSTLGAEYGVDHSIIYRIVKRKIWTHV